MAVEDSDIDLHGKIHISVGVFIGTAIGGGDIH